MRVPVSWLREYVSFDMPPRELGELLSMTGTKLEAVHRIGVPAGAELFRVGRVISREQHPDADRLSLCTVDVGDGEPRQIVCGATNFDAGATVGVALPGATLPDGTVLRVAKLRGVESHGMMLSESELELSGDHDGLMLLEDGLEPGTPLSRVLPIDDEVLEFEITSNRPDCLSVYGIAREASASLDADLAPWPGREPDASGDDSVDSWVTARIDAPDLCPRWAARVFTDVKVGPSPPWLKARVAAAGMRPISNVVDITNYVMLCVGEPTHAFDLDKVTGREIIVRRAGDGEARDHAGRPGADARCRRAGDRRCGEAVGGGRADGVAVERGVGRHHDGADGVRELRRPQHPELVDATGAAHRGLDPLGEGPRPAPGAAGARAGVAADGGADRRAAGARHR